MELQSEREDRERSVTEGDGSMQGRMESWCRDRERERFRLGGEVLRRKRPARWKSPSFFLRCSSRRSCSSWRTCRNQTNAKEDFCFFVCFYCVCFIQSHFCHSQYFFSSYKTEHTYKKIRYLISISLYQIAYIYEKKE